MVFNISDVVTIGIIFTFIVFSILPFMIRFSFLKRIIFFFQEQELVFATGICPLCRSIIYKNQKLYSVRSSISKLDKKVFIQGCVKCLDRDKAKKKVERSCPVCERKLDSSDKVLASLELSETNQLKIKGCKYCYSAGFPDFDIKQSKAPRKAPLRSLDSVDPRSPNTQEPDEQEEPKENFLEEDLIKEKTSNEDASRPLDPDEIRNRK